MGLCILTFSMNRGEARIPPNKARSCWSWTIPSLTQRNETCSEPVRVADLKKENQSTLASIILSSGTGKRILNYILRGLQQNTWNSKRKNEMKTRTGWWSRGFSRRERICDPQRESRQRRHGCHTLSTFYNVQQIDPSNPKSWCTSTTIMLPRAEVREPMANAL